MPDLNTVININQWEGSVHMGMTDRQFDAYQKNLLRRLEIALKECKEQGTQVELEKIMQDLDEQLKRP